MDITDAAVDARVLVAATADGDVSAHIAQVPQADGGIVACRQEQVALVGVECKLVDLTGMLVQSGKLDACTVQIVQNDFAIGSSGGYMGAELAMGPFDVVDAKAFTLSCMRVGIVEDGSAKIGVVDNFGVVDTDGLQDLFASQDSMGAFTIDVEGRDVEAGFVADILGVAGANAAEGGE